jgi:pseudoazurin
MRKNTIILAAAAAALIGTAAQGAEIEVKMLNKGANGAMMVFEPDFVRAAPGDTINFVPVDKAHNVESIAGMLPEGVEPFKSPMGKGYSLTLSKDGVYGVKCAPHYGMGMVALIVAGEPTNIEAAEEVRQMGKAKKVFEGLFEEIEQGD